MTDKKQGQAQDDAGRERSSQTAEPGVEKLEPLLEAAQVAAWEDEGGALATETNPTTKTSSG